MSAHPPVRLAVLFAAVLLSGPAAALATVEWCSGADDDGDGEVDEGYDCARDTEENCETRCETPGRRTCSVACTWGACAPPAEACNGRDDDCDGAADEDFDCVSGERGLCPLPGGGRGIGECGEDCRWARCVAFAGELCNGIDDDGDGAADEDFECAVGGTQPCGEADALRRCTPTCRWGPCEGVEVCNYLDDNGDGRVDEGLEYAMVAGGEVPAAGPPRLLVTAACAPGRVAVASYWGPEYWVEAITAEGRRPAAPFLACRLNPALSTVKIAWLGDNIAVACETRVTAYTANLELHLFDVAGRPQGDPVLLPVHDVQTPLDLLAGPDRLYLVHTEGTGGAYRNWLRAYDDALAPIADPVLIGDGAYAGDIRLHVDEQGAILFARHQVEEGYGVMLLHRLDPDTLQPDEGVPFPYGGELPRPSRLGSGWALFSYGHAYVIDANYELVGTVLDGGPGYDPDFDGPGLAAGVAGNQYLVNWPGWDGFRRYSADGRFIDASKPWFAPGAIDPRERLTGRAGCMLPDGRMAMAWGLGAGAPAFRWRETNRVFLSVVGCPDPPGNVEGR